MGRWIILFIAALWAPMVFAGEVTVAVASNFLTTAETLSETFEERTGHTVILSHGSTGLLFAQIEAGAPFDIMLAADTERPARLRAEGKAVKVATYAVGKLALVGRVPIARENIGEALAGHTVALADPTVAPYGKAATRAMERLSLDTATFRPVLVANVGQVASVFQTGNADFAFISASQLPLIDAPFVMDLEGIAPEVPQDAALLKSDDPAIDAFWQMLFSDEGKRLIQAAGYATP